MRTCVDTQWNLNPGLTPGPIGIEIMNFNFRFRIWVLTYSSFRVSMLLMVSRSVEILVCLRK